MKYIYLGKSLELLWAVWGQFSVRYVLVLACTCSQCLQLLLKCTVSAQLQDFNLLHLLLLGPFPLLFFGWAVLCFQVSSFWSLPWYQGGGGAGMIPYLGSLAQVCCGEGEKLQTNTSGMCRKCLKWMEHTGVATAQGSMSLPGPSPSGSQAC